MELPPVIDISSNKISELDDKLVIKLNQLIEDFKTTYGSSPELIARVPGR